MSNSKKYYESQISNTWDRSKIEFEAKLEELRQTKNDLISKKQNILSPKRLTFCQNKTLEEMQALLVLKEEENFGLSGILNNERERVKSLMNDLADLKKRSSEIEEKLKNKQSECLDMHKTLGKFFNSMTLMKKNVNHWLGSDSSLNPTAIVASKVSAELTSVKSENQELRTRLASLQKIIESQENQLIQVKQREDKNDLLLEYLKSARNSEKPKNESPKKPENQKKPKFEDQELENEEFSPKQQQIEALLKENERLRQICVDFDEKGKKHSRFLSGSYSTRNLEEYESNLKILKENNSLLLEKIKTLENEKSKLIQDHKAEKKLTAQQLSSSIISSYNSNPESQQVIQENLCSLWQSNESVFSVRTKQEMLFTLFGKDCNGLFKTMQGKLERLQKENILLQKRFSFESPKNTTQSNLSPKLSFRDAVKNKKFSNSMNQDALKEIVAKNKDFQSNLNSAFENMVTEFSDTARCNGRREGINYQDMVAFLQCSASALEECLV